MDYLPEWKIYLWKKLIVNKDGEFDGKLTTDSFRFFDSPERRKLTRDRVQKSIDRINIAVETKSLIDMSGNHIDEKDSYHYFGPESTMKALVELTHKPSCAGIKNIRIDKKYLAISGNEFKPEVNTKIQQEKELTIQDIEYSIFNNYSNNLLFSYLSFEIKIDTENLKKKLNTYLKDFTAGKLIAPKGIRYADPQKQLDDISAALDKLSGKFGKNMVLTAEEVAKAGGWYIKDEHHYRFYESVFALELSGPIDITNLRKEEAMVTLKSKNVEVKMPQLVPKSTQLYITKEGDDFRYKGQMLSLSKNTDCYKVFCSLYALIGNGGEVKYSALGKEIQSRVPKAKNFNKERMQKFIQTNLTDRSNGFTHYAGIPETEDNGKPLLAVNRGTGIIFNNRAG
jgi:hypothetical protein